MPVFSRYIVAFICAVVPLLIDDLRQTQYGASDSDGAS
jgi:hypothetical protein